MEHSAVAGERGNAGVGNPRGICRPLSDFCLSPPAPPPTSPSALLPQAMNYLVRAVFVRWRALSSLPHEMSLTHLAASFPFSALFSGCIGRPRPFAAPPWRRLALSTVSALLCAQNIPLPHLSAGSCVLPSDCADLR